MDLYVSSSSGRGLHAVGGVMVRRRDPLPDALEVDLDGVDGAAGDGRRLGACHVVELSRLHDERRPSINLRAVPVVVLSSLR